MFYELKPKQVEFDLLKNKEKLEQESLILARKNLVAGEILEENTTSNLSKDKLVAVTIITLVGNIND